METGGYLSVFGLGSHFSLVGKKGLFVDTS